jgi:hypothetical protein
VDVSLIDLLQWAILGPIAWFWKEMKAMQQDINHIRSSRPAREEMEKYVALAQRPTEVLLAQVLERLNSIETTQRELARDRNQSKE